MTTAFDKHIGPISQLDGYGQPTGFDFALPETKIKWLSGFHAHCEQLWVCAICCRREHHLPELPLNHINCIEKTEPNGHNTPPWTPPLTEMDELWYRNVPGTWVIAYQRRSNMRRWMTEMAAEKHGKPIQGLGGVIWPGLRLNMTFVWVISWNTNQIRFFLLLPISCSIVCVKCI